ncbi:phospho-sugar mutase [Erysipelotrichaceae bacterium OttesenSCG-928-M19]|nr:phospho-sugar mutase [Erysipelotrichaceae bacterium OttesenSCG-928-M19]
MKNNEYLKWLESYTINPDIKEKLFLMDKNEIEEAFSKKLDFGTAGLRAKIGPGSNRMNHYVVAKTTLGFISYLKDKYPTVYERGIVVAYDNRKFSQEFAALVANLFAREQIKVYIFNDMRPTPQLSFMIKELKCCAGINITASHNSKEYNGYKIYDSGGCQILPNETTKIASYISDIKNELEIDIENFENNEDLIYFLEDDSIFIEKAVDCLINKDLDFRDTPIVYTPLNGTGAAIIPKAIERAGFTHVFSVNEQMVPDSEFTTCPSPNPEEFNAFTLGIEKANQLKINYVIATDPDADRIGLCVRKTNNEFKLLSGNELGAILLNYILDSRQKQGLLKDNSLLIDTIVTSDLGKEIARKYNLFNISVLTGFKYIGALVNEFVQTEEYQFEFGYEESLGFLTNSYVSDKDAVSTTLVIIEMINYYKKYNKELLDVLDEIYKEFGYYQNKQISIILDSKTAQEKIDSIMKYFRNEDLEEIAGSEIIEFNDYEKQIRYREDEEIKIMLPQENAVKILLKDKGWIAIRPSGTEPKLKFYISALSDSQAAVKARIKEMQKYINDTLEELFT